MKSIKLAIKESLKAKIVNHSFLKIRAKVQNKIRGLRITKSGVQDDKLSLNFRDYIHNVSNFQIFGGFG